MCQPGFEAHSGDAQTTSHVFAYPACRRKAADNNERRRSKIHSPPSKKTLSFPAKKSEKPTAGPEKRSNASAGMQDHGGEMLCVPVWSLDDSKFKRSFPSPKNTYIVHYVMFSDIQFSQHFVAIFGTDACALQLNEEQLATYQALWKEHGGHMVPSYRTGFSTDPFAVIDLSGGKVTTRTKKKRACM